MKNRALIGLGILTLLNLTIGALTSCQNRSSLPFIGAWNFEDGSAAGWQPNDPSHWRVVEKDGGKIYELMTVGEQGRVRAPTSWSVWSGADLTSFEFSGRMKCYTDPAVPGRDMCVFFHYQDPTHFYYVHFAGESADVHNIIGLVDGADRVKINLEPAGTSAARMKDLEWHTFKVVCDARTGEIRAYIDDMEKPAMTARDLTLGHGLVGVGAFDDTGCFDKLKLRGLLGSPE